jgi:hypothetical protein
MKLATLINSQSSLVALLKNSLPVDTAWSLKLFISKVSPELTAFEELKNSKILSYGEEVTKEVDGKEQKMTQVKQENLEVFAKEINELLEKEIDVTVPVIKIGDLTAYSKKSKEPIFMNTNDLILLDWLIVA